jgi:hypothetical protein
MSFLDLQGMGSQQDIAKKLIAEQQEMPVEDIWRIIQCPLLCPDLPFAVPLC